MKKILFAFSCLISCLIVLNGFKMRIDGKRSMQAVNLPDEKGLKDFYKDYFPIGVAVNPRDLRSD